MHFQSYFQAILFTAAAVLLAVPGFADAQEPDAYENDDTAELATFTDADGIFRPHNFHHAEDEDWYMVYGIKDEVWTVSVRNTGADCDAVLSVYHPDALTLLAGPKDDAPEGIGNVEFTDCRWPDDGIYFVKISFCDACVFGEDTGYEIKIFNSNAVGVQLDIKGKIFDSSRNPVLAFVGLYDSSGKCVREIPSEEDGSFKFQMIDVDEDAAKNFDLKIKNCDFLSTVKRFSVSPPYELNHPPVDIGDIILQPSALQYRRGDVSGDGEVLLDDVKTAYRIFARIGEQASDPAFCAANVYDNGKNDISKIFLDDVKGVFYIMIGAEY